MSKWVYVILLLGIHFSTLASRIRVGSNPAVADIQQAVLAAAPHDTIVVPPGIYKTSTINIEKPLVLMGEGMPVLDGQGKHQLITVTAPHVTIAGFEFYNTGISSTKDLAGVEGLNAHYLVVRNNRFIHTFFAIHISNSQNCTIENNYLQAAVRPEYETGNGIHLWQCSGALIRNNHITRHRDGIYFEFVTQSVIAHNVSVENLRYGLHFMFSHQDEYRHNTFKKNGAGVAVMYTHNVKMQHNTFEQNEGSSVFGLLLKDITDSEVVQNRFIKNTIAVYMEGSSRTRFEENLFSGNGYGVRLQANCDNNTFTRNNFIRNTFDFATNGTLVLNNINGNYWDKYQGYDLDRDRIGDIPYRPVSLYGMVVERVPAAVFLWRSFMVFLLDRAEKALPVITPENLKDNYPRMKPYDLRS
jgi:nitrous oxidase accessory protein